MLRYIDNENTHKPFYIINACQKNNSTNDLDCYLIEGETGKVVFPKESYLRSDDSVFNEFIKITDEYKKGIYKIED